MASSKIATTTDDLYAELHQSACNKLLDSAKYPVTVFEKKQDFPGCGGLAQRESDAYHQHSKDEMRTLLHDAVADVIKPGRTEGTVYDQVFSFAGSIIEQAKKVLDASYDPNYEGPDRAELKAIVDGGTENLVDTLGDWGLYAWCSYLRVKANRRPNLTLASPRIDLTNVVVEVKATGELWAKYPWWNCYHYCLKWEKVIKCDRIGSITVAPEFKAAAHANVEASGASVTVRGEFDSLRLNYPILDKIPLEGLANQALRDKLIYTYDASKLVASVPVLQSKFTVDSISLPPSSSGIDIGVTVKQI